jgi:integrase
VGQKSRRHEVAPVVPDFGQWILDHTPEAQRTGRVFPMSMCAIRVGKTIGAIGERAGIVVGTRERVTKEGGRLVRTPVKVFASAHDLRRSFCTRWAQKVTAPVLQKLARHSDIRTTQTYYVTLDAKDLTASLWANHAPASDTPAQGNISGNNARKTTGGGVGKVAPKPLADKRLSTSTP